MARKQAGVIRAFFTRRWLLTTLLVLVAAGVCVRLGIWQLDRLQQRRAFNAEVIAARAMPAAILPNDTWSELAYEEYRAVRASGTYDFAHQVALRNQYYGNEYGFHLLTPLVLPDGTAILVDRGWIPADGNGSPSAWRRYDAPARASVSGIVRLSRAAPDFAGIPDPTLTPGQAALELWYMPNVDRIALQMPYHLLPVYIQLDPEPARVDPPIPFQPEVDLGEGPHQGYALQWFTFASILFLGYPFYLRRQIGREKKS